LPRTLEIAVASPKTDEVLGRLRRLDGVVGIALQRGASLEPAGDVLTVRVTNAGLEAAFRILDECDVAANGAVATSEPHCLLVPGRQNAIESESNETIWEEVASLLRRDSNLSSNYLGLMMLAGAIAGAGLWTDTLHIVVGAMLLAPGFEPLARIPFAFIGGPLSAARRGLASVAVGYAVLALGAALAALLLQAVGSSASSDLGAREWVRYWSSIQPSGIVVALFAGAAGALVLISRRTVFAAGVSSRATWRSPARVSPAG
jgi:Domain of unknown function (DUF389)